MFNFAANNLKKNMNFFFVLQTWHILDFDASLTGFLFLKISFDYKSRHMKLHHATLICVIEFLNSENTETTNEITYNIMYICVFFNMYDCVLLKLSPTQCYAYLYTQFAFSKFRTLKKLII